MREIHIFIASSVFDKDLAQDRNALSDYLIKLNKHFEPRGVKLVVERCEHESYTINPDGTKQAQYDARIETCDLLVLLCSNRLGEYTRGEFDLAWKLLQEKRSPQILTYFRGRFEDAREENARSFRDYLEKDLGHFFQYYEDAERLKYYLRDELTILDFDISQVPPNWSPLGLDNLARTSEQTNYARLRDEFLACRRELEEARARFSDPLDYVAQDRRYRQAKDALEEIIRNLSRVLQSAEATKNIDDARIQRVNTLVREGRFAEANAALPTEDILADLPDLKRRKQALQKETQDYVNILLQKADLLNMEGRHKEMQEPLHEATELETENSLPKKAMRAYIHYLYQEHDFTHGIPLAKEYLDRYMTYEGDRWHIADAANWLGLLTYEAHDFDTAETAYRKAKRIWEALAQEDPEAHQNNLAATCNNLGNLLSDTGHMEEAEAEHRRAKEIYETLTEAHPGAYLPYLATTCNNLGNLLKNTGRMDEAEAEYRRAKEIREALAEAHPGAYLPDLAQTLNNLGVLLKNTGRMPEAEAEYRRAKEIREALAEAHPGAYLPDLAMSCNNLGVLLSDTGRMDEGEAEYRRAKEIYETLAEAHPGAYLPYLAATCNNLGNLLSDTGHMEEAEAEYRRAKEIRETLAKVHPGAYLPDLAMSCNNLGALYAQTGRMDEAEAEYRRAKEIRETLAEAHPGVYLPNLAQTLNNLGVLLKDTDRMDEAEAEYRRAKEIREALAESHPGAYLPDLAQTLNNLGNLLKNTGHMEEAEAEYRRAKEIYETLAESHPGAYLPYLAATCNNLGNLLSDTGHMEEAEAEYRCAKEIREALATAYPGGYSGDVGDTCFNLGLLHRKQNHREAALEAFQAAARHYTTAAQFNPIYQKDLEQTQAILAQLTAPQKHGFFRRLFGQ